VQFPLLPTIPPPSTILLDLDVFFDFGCLHESMLTEVARKLRASRSLLRVSFATEAAPRSHRLRDPSSRIPPPFSLFVSSSPDTCSTHVLALFRSLLLDKKTRAKSSCSRFRKAGRRPLCREGGLAPEKVQDPGFAHVMQKGGAAQPVVEVAFEAGLVVVDVSVDLLNFFKLVSAHPAPEAEAQFA